MAVAGFGSDELTVETKNHTCTCAASASLSRAKAAELLYRGIAARNFERRFQLADYVEVAGASMENGLLHIDLKRELPDAMKPRTIAIATGASIDVDAKKS